MTKAELAERNKKLSEELETLKKLSKEALISILEATCTSSHEHIQNFCDHTGVSFPTKIVRLEIPYGKKIEYVQDDNAEDFEFKQMLY